MTYLSKYKQGALPMNIIKIKRMRDLHNCLQNRGVSGLFLGDNPKLGAYAAHNTKAGFLFRKHHNSQNSQPAFHTIIPITLYT